MRIDLLQSPTIRILEQSELSGALTRMQRDGNQPITSEVARELAAREGYGAVIEGEVGTAGSSYVLTARIVGGEGWTSLAAFRETANGDDDLIEAIEDLSRSIRDKAGESLRTVRSAPPLERVSTASLDALRAYTRAEGLEDRGDTPAALELYERAVELDPEFAMAHRKIGVILGNMNVRRRDQITAVRSAYELRDRLPEGERYLAEGFYYNMVTGDQDAAIRSYEALLSVDPENSSAMNNLGNLYRTRGRFEEAEELYARALAIDRFDVGYYNLARTRLLMGRAEDAERTLDSAVAALPEAAFVFENERTDHVIGSADYQRADSLARAYEASFPQPQIARTFATSQRYRLDAIRGRLRAAEQRTEDLRDAPGFLGNPLVIASLRANLHLQRGDGPAAARTILDAMTRHRDSVPPGDRPYGFVIRDLVDAGDAAAAASLLDEWKREVPDEELGGGGRADRQSVEAGLMAARGNTEEALRLLELSERDCPGTCAASAALARAITLDESGDGAAAVAEYERFLTAPEHFRSWINAQWRARALERLGQLHDEQGNLEDAAKYYAMFVEQWAEADPELRPRVQAAQARLEEIVRERG